MSVIIFTVCSSYRSYCNKDKEKYKRVTFCSQLGKIATVTSESTIGKNPNFTVNLKYQKYTSESSSHLVTKHPLQTKH